ncbi:hypothetical protein ULMS_20620 [Patiriisocius marinistellae]|uniref:Uncharacterized protein n=1 Tax=Patiriisocius marinistellae TaxID=2494560 RepID=A0A5J4FZD9_9FLAO|nr:hypothetical protein [Patiriisocius marinistellae]GEQ86554.1 hypothetical protein ULMS_20620 [Patiriisocius marinistellae]
MSTLSEHVDTLENRVSKLLHKYTNLQQQKAALAAEIKVLKEKQVTSQKEIEEWRSTCDSLKLANSMLGSDQYKRDTKLKINALVREIDQCITQLSD